MTQITTTPITPSSSTTALVSSSRLVNTTKQCSPHDLPSSLDQSSGPPVPLRSGVSTLKTSSARYVLPARRSYRSVTDVGFVCPLFISALSPRSRRVVDHAVQRKEQARDGFENRRVRYHRIRVAVRCCRAPYVSTTSGEWRGEGDGEGLGRRGGEKGSGRGCGRWRMTRRMRPR